jgi:hypothetical protein
MESAATSRGGPFKGLSSYPQLVVADFLQCHGQESHEELATDLLHGFIDFLAKIVQG